MFLWFIKPKGRKHYKDNTDYHNASTVYSFFAVAKYLSYCMWFLCIPFLLMDYSGMVGIFLNVTIACVVTDFLEKVFHHDYKYF